MKLHVSGGDIQLQPGSGILSDGSVQILNRDSSAILDTSFLTNSVEQSFTFPNFSGTFGLLEANQTWTGLNKFEASSNSTIYVGSSTKTGCIVLGDSDGAGVTYVTANDGVLSASTTKPNFCQ